MTNKQTSGVFVTHSECLGEECNSSDAMAIHAQEDGTYDAYCWSCDGYFNWDKLKEGGWTAEDLNNKPRGKTKRPLITKEEILSLKNETVIDPTLYRGLKTEHNKFYGIRTKLVNGKVTERHYPVTKDGKPSGYKKRVHPKDFTQGYLGYNGQDCDLFGAVRFPKGGKYILLASGEEDTVAAFQMLRDDQLRRNKAAYQPVAVVSSTVGENCVKQIKNNYEYLTSFEKIIVCPDQDDAGLKAVEKILQVLPPDKTFVMQSPEKDANKCIDEKREVEFVRAFYSAIQVNPVGIVGSGELMGMITEYARTPRLPLPTFLSKVQEMQAGGPPLGVIINLASSSGAGKSTLVNELIYQWLFHSLYRIGVCPLEGGLDYFGECMLSRHLGQKLALISDPKEKLALLDSAEVKEKADELWYNDFGDHRFELINGEGALDIARFQERAEYLVRAKDVKVLVVDTLTKLMEGESTEKVYGMMKWQNDFVVQNKCIIVNILQVRKSMGGKKANSVGADIHEEDMSGVGSILQTGACNLLFMRNKESEDDIERNTTKIMQSKCRWSGITGPAGYLYYDNATHTLHNKDKYFEGRAENEEVAAQEEEFRTLGAFDDADKNEF